MNKINKTRYQIPKFRLASTIISLAISLAFLVPATLAGRADASSPYTCHPPGGQILTSVAAAPPIWPPDLNSGFWIQLDGFGYVGTEPRLPTGTYPIDGAPTYANITKRGTIVSSFVSFQPVIGYYVVTDNGQIIPEGSAVAQPLCNGYLSNCSGFPSNPRSHQIIVGAAVTASGYGLWALGRDGKVWTAGDAPALGDVQKDGSVPTAIVGTPTGRGYYIVLEDGGVYTFGDAKFFGRFPQRITGIALAVNVNCDVIGYWLVDDRGGVYSFGQAPFYGSTGGNNDCEHQVTSIISFPSGHRPNAGGQCYATQGYALVNARAEVAVFTANGVPKPVK